MQRRMRTHRLLALFERLLLFVIAFAVVVYIIVALNAWAEGFRRWFWFVGDLQTFIFITIALMVFTYVLRKLLVWQWRESVR